MFNIFISYRYEDKDLADIIRDNLQDWGVQQEWIFQSKQPKQGVIPGENVQEAIKNTLRQTDLFVLVFTTDEKSSYCTYEWGVADGGDTRPTRFLVIKCLDEEPKIGRSRHMINVDQEADILDFAMHFHKDPDFLTSDQNVKSDPAFSEFVDKLGGLTDESIADRAKKLYEALRDKKVELENNTSKERDRLLYIKFELDESDAKEVRDLESKSQTHFSRGESDEAKSARAESKEMLKTMLKVSVESDSKALQEFDLDVAREHTNFSNLINGWKERLLDKLGIDELEASEEEWIDLLLDDISRATVGRSSKPIETGMQSIRYERPVYLQPITVRTREYESGRTEYYVYLFKIPKLRAVRDADGN